MRVVCVSIEKQLLRECDALARRRHLSRAALISEGLNQMLQEKRGGVPLEIPARREAPARRESLAASESAAMIVKVMGRESLVAQRERIEAEVLAYTFAVIARGVFTETLELMREAGFDERCFGNRRHRLVFAAAVKLALERRKVTDAAVLNLIPKTDRDDAGVVLCAIATFDVIHETAFKRYLEQILRFDMEGIVQEQPA